MPISFGNSAAASKLNGPSLTLNGNTKTNFTTVLDKIKINLWATNEYGFGIAAYTLQYSSMNTHAFILKTKIDSAGNTSCIGIKINNVHIASNRIIISILEDKNIL
jgi:hypothetical protein